MITVITYLYRDTSYIIYSKLCTSVSRYLYSVRDCNLYPYLPNENTNTKFFS